MAVFAAARAALLPGLAFWDTGEYQAVGPLLGTAHPTGFPTYVLLGWLASVVLQPLGDPAFRMNLLAAHLPRRRRRGHRGSRPRPDAVARRSGSWPGSRWPSRRSPGRSATHAETHALHLALVAILLWLLVGWEDRARDVDDRSPPGSRPTAGCVAATVVYGLAVGNHSLTLLLAPPIGLFVLAVEPDILRRPAAGRARASACSS